MADLVVSVQCAAPMAQDDPKTQSFPSLIAYDSSQMDQMRATCDALSSVILGLFLFIRDSQLTSKKKDYLLFFLNIRSFLCLSPDDIVLHLVDCTHTLYADCSLPHVTFPTSPCHLPPTSCWDAASTCRDSRGGGGGARLQPDPMSPPHSAPCPLSSPAYFTCNILWSVCPLNGHI